MDEETRKERIPDPIGWVVWWTLAPSTYEVVNAQLRKAGIEPTGFVQRPPYWLALRRALNKVAAGWRSRGRKGGDLLAVQPLDYRKGVTYAAVVATVRDAEGEPEAFELFRLRATADEEPDWPAGEDAREVLSAYREERDVCSGESLGRVLVGVVEERGNGCCLRPGLYYVPWHGSDDRNPGLIALRSVLGGVPGCELHSPVVRADRTTLLTMVPAARSALEGDVDALVRRVEKWTGHKKKSLKKMKVRDLLPVRKKIEHYENRLGVDLYAVKKRCDELAAVIEEKLNQPVRRRPRLEQPPEPEPVEDGLNRKQRLLLEQARDGIGQAVAREEPYLRNVCDVALASVAHYCGVAHANSLIEEFDLRAQCGVRQLEEVDHEQN